MESKARIITSVVAQKRDQSRCSVFVDGEFTFGCSNDVAVAFGLRKGLQIDERLEREIRQREARQQLKKDAIMYASYKARTERQVRLKLREKGYDAAEADIAIDFLEEFDYLDDRKYAGAFIRDYLERKPSGAARVREELRKRGIASQTIDQALALYFPKQDVHELLLEAARKKIKSLGHKPPDKRRNALIRFLQRRGFAWEHIRVALESLSDEVDGDT